MANILTGLIPVMYRAYDTVAREQLGFVKSVMIDADASGAAIGQTITTPVVPAKAAYDMVAGQLPADNGDSNIGNIGLTITKMRAVPIRYTGEEQLSIKGIYAQVLQDEFAQAFRTLTNEIENDLATAAITGASRAVGTAGTTPFGTNGDLSDFAAVQQVLDETGTPTGDRSIVLSSASMANVRGKQGVLFKANEAGTTELLRNGTLARVEGLDVKYSMFAGANVKGTGAGYLVNKAGGHPAGDSAITVDTGTGTVLAGNVVTFAGDTNKYVTSGLTGSVLTLNKPGLRSVAADNAAITVGNSYAANVAFHKSALVLLCRTPAMPAGGDSAKEVEFFTDPVSGLTFRIALYTEYLRNRIEVSIVWGTKAVKSDFITILQG